MVISCVMIAACMAVCLFLSWKVCKNETSLNTMENRVDKLEQELRTDIREIIRNNHDTHMQEHGDLCNCLDRIQAMDKRIEEIDNLKNDVDTVRNDTMEAYTAVASIMKSWNVSVPYLMDMLRQMAEDNPDSVYSELWNKAGIRKDGEENKEE